MEDGPSGVRAALGELMRSRLDEQFSRLPLSELAKRNREGPSASAEELKELEIAVDELVRVLGTLDVRAPRAAVRARWALETFFAALARASDANISWLAIKKARDKAVNAAELAGILEEDVSMY
jgi:hypothetical protein